jgi:hypothetical protein
MKLAKNIIMLICISRKDSKKNCISDQIAAAVIYASIRKIKLSFPMIDPFVINIPKHILSKSDPSNYLMQGAIRFKQDRRKLLIASHEADPSQYIEPPDRRIEEEVKPPVIYIQEGTEVEIWV